MSKRVQPPWSCYSASEDQPVLKLYNSLTRQKEIFVPRFGRKVYWYSCGPTVYDASHMGHARSYITFDILRRVLTEYFNYDIFYVMNITDIDDKIIKRARQNYLFKNYISDDHDLESVIDDVKGVLGYLDNKSKQTSDREKKSMYNKMLNRLSKSIENLEKAVKGENDTGKKAALNQLIKENKDPFSDWLDSKFGTTITDNKIFSSLPRHWEDEFHKDMDSLNVLRPNVITRVSEHMPEIISFIEGIVKNGYGYIANGSVYFDVAKFDKNAKHHYAKLVPEAYGDWNSLQEGEGDLTTAEMVKEKKSANDFALWKKSKPGEPSWESPWSLGRPGWHIECSAMASAVCGPYLDIHTGGVDLKFPHHDNEIAQSEAYFENPEWVKYFLHSGHLTISGCKMSKSLKNFVSIQDALSKYTARQLRFAFLLHSWRDTLDYSKNTMECALLYEKIFNEFFLNIKSHMDNSYKMEATNFETFPKWTDEEIKLNNFYLDIKEQVHVALCNNIDTRTALDSLRDIVSSTNSYMHNTKPLNKLLLRDIAVYITKILSVFGTINRNQDTEIGFPSSTSSGDECYAKEELIMPYLKVLAEFRDKIRIHGKNLKSKEILQECDYIRDEILPNVGVRLEDKEGQASILKLVDKETLLKEREKLQIECNNKQLEKEKRLLAQKEDKEAKDAQKKIPPSEIFKSDTDKYLKFDDKGFPTHDINGKEITKSQMKKLKKIYDAQEKRYNEYLASQQ